jgi:hypothetical protein
MKKRLLTFAFFAIFTCLFSVSTFAQVVPGGEDDGTGTGPDEGGGTVTTPYTYNTYAFKRNNGNGIGVCGDRAQIRVVFSPMPPTAADIPKVTAIWYQGHNLLGTSVGVSATTIVDQTQPYVSYCLTGLLPSPGVSGGNIPPAEKLTLEFSHN